MYAALLPEFQTAIGVIHSINTSKCEFYDVVWRSLSELQLAGRRRRRLSSIPKLHVKPAVP